MAIMQDTDLAAEAWLRVMGLLAESMTGGSARTGLRGTARLVTGVPVAQLNGVVSIAREPDPAECAQFAASMDSLELPWSIQVRGDRPDEELTRLAASHGLEDRSTLPFMLRSLDDRTAEVVAPEAGTIRRIGSASSTPYLAALAGGFEAPPEVFARLVEPAVLDHPRFSTYLVEVDGEAVATAVGVLVGDQVGVFNISVPPAHRRRGYGRAATAAALRDGYAAGARTAWLHASSLGVPLYESMGFAVAERWTVFS